jgi:ADP-ribose pyrophosphatase
VSVEPTIASRLIFRGRAIALRVDEVRLPSGRTASREIVEHPGAAAVVPLTDDDHVVLVRQPRKALERELLEIPAGTLEPGEAPLACAHRELAEETGLRADEMTPLLTFAPSPGILTEEITIFVARGLRADPGAAPEAEEEGLRVERVSLSAVPALINAGDIRDAKSVIGLLLLRWR